MSILSNDALDQLFNDARTYSAWLDKPVDNDLLHRLYDLVKMGPTSANCLPLRIVFITTLENKEKLRPCLAEGNVEKTMSAPVTAILAYDIEFYEHLKKTFPIADAKPWFTQSQKDIHDHAFRNASLQAGYLIMAARALGLDCGPMSGFNSTLTDELFLKGTSYRSNFLCNLGYGDTSKLYPRLYRLSFEETCTLI